MNIAATETRVLSRTNQPARACAISISRPVIAFLLGFLCLSGAARADIVPGGPVVGEVEGRFIGTVVELVDTGVYRLAVRMGGKFKSGVPFVGPLVLDIETTETLVLGEAVRGRVRAQISGAIDSYSDEGLKFTAAASEVEYQWQTIQNFGSTSKGGGTNIFRLELADIIFDLGSTSVVGSAEGNNI